LTDKNIEVFKTNVQKESEANKIILKLLGRFAYQNVNFDLEDCDKILRISHSQNINEENIVETLESLGYFCQPLSD
tara:strand:- start:35535 stop:35762 length:228 start_codon:yes stop_codon:yes gene_type:complete